MKKQIECDNKIKQACSIAVVQCKTANEAIDIAQKLLDSNVCAMEIAYRDINNFDIADECIKAVRKYVPKMLVGAATVINVSLVKRAVRSGAMFVLSPGFNPKTVKYCINHNIPIYPGVATPSDIEVALEYGLSTLKYFPAEIMGGIKMIKALAGPYPQVKFIVSGGLNEENFHEYTECKNVLAVSGSWLVSNLKK